MKASRLLLAVLSLCLSLQLAATPALAHDGEGTQIISPVAPPPPPVTPVGAVDARETPWPFVLTGVGLLTLGTGIWLVHRDDSDAAMPACTTLPDRRTTCPYSTSSAWQGWGVVAIGAQLVAVGVAWRLYEVKRATGRISLAAVPGGLRLAGSF